MAPCPRPGAGIAHYRPREHHRGLAWTILATAGLAVALLLLTGGGSPAHASAPVTVAAFSPAWAQFQQACVSGGAPGQGEPAAARECWEGNLEQAAIVPGYALDVLNAAQVGGGQAYMVGENLSGGPVGWAMQGCGLNST